MRSSSSATAGVTLNDPIQAPAAASAATRASTSAIVSSPSQPAPITASSGSAAPARAAAIISASQSGLPRPGSEPVAIASPPTSTAITRSQPSASAAAAIPSAAPSTPSVMSIRTVVVSSSSATCASENRTPSTVVVSASARRACAPTDSPPVISLVGRGPGRGSIGSRSHATPPSSNGVPRSSQRRATASEPTTSPPPPMPSTSARRAAAIRWSNVAAAIWLGQGRLGVADLADRRSGPLELLVGHHRSALEGQLAVDLDPGAATVVLVLDPHGHRPWDPVDPQQEDVERMPALPAQPLRGVVLRPHVVRRQRVDDAGIVGLEMVGDLGPGADPHPIRLRDAAVLKQCPGGRLLVGPDALLERAPQLRVVGVADEVVSLVVERGVEEELLVRELEVLVLLADAALAEGD